jgi:hypothetical protein
MVDEAVPAMTTFRAIRDGVILIAVIVGATYWVLYLR